MREALDAQSSLSKRQRAEMEAMAHELSALKVWFFFHPTLKLSFVTHSLTFYQKLNQNQRNELKQISTVAVGDLQVIMHTIGRNLKSPNRNSRLDIHPGILGKVSL